MPSELPTVAVLQAAQKRLHEAIDARDHEAICNALDTGDAAYFQWMAEKYDPSTRRDGNLFQVLVHTALSHRLEEGEQPNASDVIELFLDLGLFDVIFPRNELIQDVRSLETLSGAKPSDMIAGATNAPMGLNTLPFKYSDQEWRVAWNAWPGRREQLEFYLGQSGTGEQMGEDDLNTCRHVWFINKLFENAKLTMPPDLRIVCDQLQQELDDDFKALGL